MGYVLIFAGLVILYLTYLDYCKSETDTIFILDWWLWFDVHRNSFPLLFWIIIIIQTVFAIGLIMTGVTEL